MAVKPMVVIAKAINTARVTLVEPVMQGSRIEAVKQKRDFCKMKPKQQPKAQNNAMELLFNPSKMPIPMMKISTSSAIGSWLFFFLRGVDLRIGVAEVFVVSGIPITSLGLFV